MFVHAHGTTALHDGLECVRRLADRLRCLVDDTVKKQQILNQHRPMQLKLDCRVRVKIFPSNNGWRQSVMVLNSGVLAFIIISYPT